MGDILLKGHTSISTSPFCLALPDLRVGGCKDQTSLAHSILFTGAGKLGLTDPSLPPFLSLSLVEYFLEAQQVQVLLHVLGHRSKQGRQDSRP